MENEVQIDGLRTFIDDSIKEKEEELECPVWCPWCHDTPESLGMEENDQIFAFDWQFGEDLSEEEISLSVSLSSFKGFNDIHFFKVKKTTKMNRLKNSFSAKVGIPDTSLTFVFCGVRINGDDTPESLGMEENDEIDAVDWFREEGGSKK